MAGPVTYPAGPGVIVTRDGQSGQANITKVTFWTGVDAPTETVLVSGVNAATGSYKEVTLTAARVVGAPLNPSSTPLTGMVLVFTFIQGGAGAFAVTWNAVFKGITGGTSGATGTRATFPFIFDGTNWSLIGAQPTWVA